MKLDPLQARQQLQQYLAQQNRAMALPLCESLWLQNTADQQLGLLLIQLLLSTGKVSEAGEVRQRLLKALPGSVQLHRSLAEIHQRFGRLDTALEDYEAASELVPDDTGLQLARAALLIHVRRYDDAVKVLQGLIERGHESSQLHLMLGAAHHSLQDTDAALRHYLASRKLDPDNLDAASGVANVYLLRREYAQANAILKPIVTSTNAPVSAILLYGQFASHLDDEEQAIEVLTAALSRQGLTDKHRSMLHFALGKLRDERGEYDEAFAHYRQGNELENPAYDEAQVEADFDSIRKVFTPEFIRRHRRPAGGERLVFIVGMPRSGTSLTEQILASHPDVFGAGELQQIRNVVTALSREHGEGQAFPDYCRQLSEQDLNKGASRYTAYVNSLDDQAKRISDKMPENFLYLGMINLLFPDARVIHCIRHPYDTCLSCYFQQFSGHQPYAYRLENLAHYYRCYQALMKHWQEALTIPVLDFHYEELLADSRGQTERLLSHCGLEWNEACLEFDKSRRAITTASAQQASQPLYTSSRHRYRNYEQHLEPLISRFEGIPDPAF